MPEFPDIPPLHTPPWQSTMAFSLVIGFVVISLLIGIWHSRDESKGSTRMAQRFSWGLLIWLAICGALPYFGILRINILPPPMFPFIGCSFALGAYVAFSQVGKQLTSLPVHWLIGFHAFRLPLELVLHYWYKVGAIPIQMTYEGYNFDIATGILAILIWGWARFGSPPQIAYKVFNVIGIVLLVTVISIAFLSAPSPFRQFPGEPLLLPFYFPFSYIVSIAVTGALIGHLVLFRKLAMGTDTVAAES